MRTASTEFKNLEGIAFEFQIVADKFIKDPSMKINPDGDYFYSKTDSKVHKSKDIVNGKYYDEERKAYSRDTSHKVVATSDKEKYPELRLLTALDLAR